MISIRKFAAKGLLGETRLGVGSSSVIANLGPPDSRTQSQVDSRASNVQEQWTYGDFAFHFHAQKLVKIHAEDFRDAPQLNEQNPLDAWILDRRIGPGSLKLQLESEGIAYRKRCMTHDPWYIHITTSAGVCFRFTSRPDDLNDHRLSSFWHAAAR